ncbi:MAG: DNA-3-methyladenine glycosylase I [Myxococcales bacterium]|nr:DNA-3-methyladenine glycosylase I [Myxococcales bacterium]
MPAPKIRCAWAGTDPIYVAYHDTEWGVPVRDDRLLFEFLVLEGSTIVYAHMQAVGMVNDHVVSCFRHRQVARLGKA